MARYSFERDSRTPSSETLLILEGERQIGRVDLHYAPTVVHGTLVVNESVTQEEIEDLVQIIDEELVMPAETPREDFVIAVYQGREVGVYSDQDFEEEEEEEEQERERHSE